jgi:adenylate cyclase
MEPEPLFSELNEIFTTFDNICEKFDCERIETIGDAYLAVSEMHTKNEKHALSITSAAIEMREYLYKRNQSSQHKWLYKIGLHSGSLMGGVVGKLKYIYDIFGDGVNTAARMETASEPMTINISQSTYSKIHLNFTVEKRALLPIKGKGSMQMYFVHDHKK